MKKMLPSLALAVHVPLAFAAEPPKIDGANTAWMLTAAVLVLFMTLPGLALFYAGLVRAKAAFGGVGYPEKVDMAQQVTTQLVGIAAVGAWSAIMTWILLKLSDALAGLRVTGDQETEGLDTVLHNEKGYNL